MAGWLSWLLGGPRDGGRRSKKAAATIDLAKAAPPPSPLKPIDLTDDAQMVAIMTLAARIGGLLLASGMSNNDARAQMHAVTSAFGLVNCQVDVTFTSIVVYTDSLVDGRPPIVVHRQIRRLSTDFSRLSQVDRLIRKIGSGGVSPGEAIAEFDAIVSAPRPYGQKMSIFGWMLLAASVAVMLGGGAPVGVLSFLTAGVIMSVAAWLDNRGLPVFFQNLTGGVVATVPAALTYRFATDVGVALAPGQVIASGIVVLLAGLTLVQSLQDGITGAPVTASARFFDTMLQTGAIVAGVAIGIEISSALGVTLPTYEPTTLMTFSSVSVKIVAGAAAAAAFALACLSEWPSVLVSGVTAAAGPALMYLVFQPMGISPVTSVGMAATVVGLAGGLLARKYQIPPLITALAGITPLLPGLAIYRGMYAMMHDQMLLSYTLIVVALGTAAALAAGVVLGEWVAAKLRRPPRFRPYSALRRRTRSPF